MDVRRSTLYGRKDFVAQIFVATDIYGRKHRPNTMDQTVGNITIHQSSQLTTTETQTYADGKKLSLMVSFYL